MNTPSPALENDAARDGVPLDAVETQFQWRTLRAITVVLVALYALRVLASITLGRPMILAGVTSAGAVGAIAALAIGWAWTPRHGWLALLVVGCAVTLSGLWHSGGVDAPQTAALILIVLVAGRMLGPRWALGVAAPSIVLLFALALMHSRGLVPQGLALTDPFQRVAYPAIYVLLTGVLCWYFFSHRERQVRKMREDGARVESNARELAASESRLQTMFESSLVPQLVTDAQTWEIRDANAAFVELSGQGRDALIGRRARDVALLADTASFDAIREAISARGVVDRLEVALRPPDGPARRCLLSCRAMQVGARPIRLWSIVDITEIREAERALRASQQRFEALFQASPIAASIASVDEGRILEVNRAYETMFGRTREQAIGRTGRELGLYRDYSVREEGLARIRAEGRLQDVEAEIVTASGEVRNAIGSVVIIEWEGEPAALFQMIDVTERRRAELALADRERELERIVAQRTSELSRANDELTQTLEALRGTQHQMVRAEKLAALGRLVAGVAHELNTPIGNSLLSASTLHDAAQAFAQSAAAPGLRRSVLDGFVTNALEASRILVNNLERAAELISSFKQVAADQTSSQRRRFALDQVVDEVLLAHRPTFKAAEITIEVRIPHGIELDSYPGPLGQVIGNLVSNAVMHGYEGRERGEVTVSAESLPGGDVEIRVADRGRGIAQADLARIFDPFFTSRLGRGGTGLGLGICENIVGEALGGTIRAESRVGEGSVFVVRIPRVAPVPARPQET